MTFFKKVSIRLAVCGFYCSPLLHAAVLVWTNTAGGNWSGTSNWSPNQVPGAGDTALITNSGSYVVTLDSNQAVGSFTLGGASGQQTLATSGTALSYSQPSLIDSNGIFQLSGGGLFGATTTGNLTISGQFDWSSGNLGGANAWLDVTTNGVLTVDGTAGAAYALGEVLTNSGTINLVSGNLNIDYCGTNFGTLINLPGGAVNFQADVSISQTCGGPGFFNGGLVTKLAGTGVSYITATFGSTGTVNAQSGNMALSGGGNLSGLVEATAGSAIYQTNGTISGAETIIGTVYSSGVTISAGGSLTVPTNGVLNVVGNFNVEGPLTNNGTVNWQGGNFTMFNNDNVSYTGGIWNEPGAQFNCECDQTLSDEFGPAYEIFHNAGSLIKTNSTMTTAVDVYLDNAGGTVQAQSGLIQFNNGSNLAGTFQATNGVGAITFNGGNFTWNGTANLQGNAQFTGGAVNVTESIGSLPAMSGVAISGLSNVVGSVTLTGATIVGNPETLTCTALLTNCNFSGRETVAGTVSLAGGSLLAGGWLAVAGGGTLNFTGNSTFNVGAPLTNNGTVNWLGGTITVQNNNNTNSYTGGIWNDAGAQWLVQCNQTLGDYYGSGYEIFHNAGLFSKNNSTATTTFTVYLDNAGGTVQALSGSIQINNGSNLAGTFGATTGGTVIQFNGGNFVWNGTASFQGNVQFTGGNVSVAGSIGVLPPMSGVAVSGLSNVVGTVTLTSCTIVGNPETLTCTAFLTNCNCGANETVAGTISWNGGTLQDNGALTVAAAGTLNLVGNNTFYVEAPLTNNGTINWPGGNITVQNNNNPSSYTGAIWNQAGGQWLIESNATLGDYYNSGYEIFHNAGYLIKTNATGTTSFTTYLDNAGGTVQAYSGLIQINNGCNLLGSFQASGGGAIQFNSGSYVWNGTASFLGNVQFTGGNVAVAGNIGVLPPMSGVTISGLSNVVGTVTLTGCTIVGNPEILTCTAFLTNCNWGANETVAGAVSWNGGTLQQSGSLTVATAGTLNLVGNSAFFVEAPLTNNGTVNWPGGNITVQNNNNPNSYTGVIWNQAGGQWLIESNATLGDYYNSGYEVFHNAGYLIKTNATGTTSFTVYLDNAGGTVQAYSGIIQINNSCNLLGGFQASAGAAIEFNSGNFVWSGTPNFTGNVQITGGFVTITGSTPAFVATSATVTNLAYVTGTAWLTNCNIGDPETIVGTVNWDGGVVNIRTGASLTVAGGGVLNLTGGNTFQVEGPLTNNGTVNWTGGTVQVLNNNGSYTGGIWNQPGAQWTMLGALAMQDYFGSGYEFFNNSGTLINKSGSGSVTFTLYLNNSLGTVEALGGIIVLNNGCNLLGGFQASAGAAIEFNSGNFVWSGTPNFTGNVQITGGFVTITGSTPAFVATSATVTNLAYVTGTAWLTNCNIGDPETIVGTVNWDGGVVNIRTGASLTVAGGGVLNLTGGNTFQVEGPLTNNGTVNWTGGTVQVLNNNGSYTGGIWNQPGAQWDIQCNASLSDYFGSGYEVFQNAGLVSQSGVTGTTTFSVNMVNSGTLDVQSGLINFTGNPAYVEAGETLDFGISGTNNNYGRISLPGNVNFDGTLGVNFVNGYTPVTGSVFNLFNYGTHGGSFAGLDLPVLAAGQAWQVDYTGSSLSLRVDAVGTNDNLLISGTVTTTNGNPIAGATVYAYINTNTFTNLIVNGSFELPANNGASYITYNPGSTNIPGWTVTSAGIVDISDGFLGQAEDGAQYFDPSGSTSTNGGIMQTFPTTPGTTYRLSFYLGCYVNPGQVSLGVTVGSVSNSFTGPSSGGFGSFNWTPESIVFTATSGVTTVTFQGLLNFDSNDSFVDNVQVTPVDAGRVLEATTGSNGQYQIPVANGTFQVGVSGLPALGYNNVAEQMVVVSNANQTVNFVAPALTGAQLFTITTAVNPAGAGTTGGDGTFGSGAVATVTATPVTTTLPYLFSSWTENGVFQSATNNYSFTVLRNRNLVANFTLPIFTVTASNNPVNGGVISGAGSYFYGATNVLTTVPNFGFIFTNWTQGTNIVGTSLALSTVVYSNLSFVANYIDANLNHQVTTATLPPGLATVAGAGTYTNGQTTQFSTPQFVTNSPFFYIFQEYTVSNTVVSTTNTFSKTFSTLDATNLQYVAVYKTMTILPMITNVTANYGDPVPATTNFLLALQFDRSMNTNIAPTVVLTNSAAVSQPVVTTNGYWTGTISSHDTYHTPPVTFAPGMDGTMQLFVSGAQDPNGDILALTNAATFTVVATPPPAPVLTLVSSNSTSVTVGWPAYSAPADLAGFRVYIENTNYSSLLSVPVYTSLGSTARSYTYGGLLLNTNYYLAVQAVDSAGNALTPVTPIQVYLPSTVPPPVTIQVTTAGVSSALVAWNTYGTSALLGFAGYQVYLEQTNFTSVTGLLPQTTVAAGQTSVQINGLNRLQTNYFAVVGYNNTNGFNPKVTTATWTDPFAGNITANLTIGGSSPSIVNIYHSITVVNNAQLTVAPGTTLLFTPGTSLSVTQGALIANGTALAPIIFDSANDQPGLTPAPGDWRGVSLITGAGTSSLNFVEILYGGGLTVSGCSPTVQDLTANQNTPWGLGLSNGAALSTSAALLSGNAVGAQQFDTAALTIQNSVIQNNNTNAWADGAAAMNATSNYWGSSLPANITASLAGNVNYTPFLTYEPLLTPAIGTSNNVTQVGGSSVNLQLACRTAVSMRLSEDFTFTGVFFSPFTNYDNFALSAGGGEKHIFAQFRSITGATNTPIELDVDYITAGPVIQIFSLNNGETLSRPVTVTATATATLGMKDIEFYVDGVGLATNTGGSFSYYFDIRSLSDAVHQVVLLARDTAGNIATLSDDVVIAVTPPVAPVLTAPSADYTTNNATLTIRGTAEEYINIQVTDNGQVLGVTTTDANGNFAVTNAVLQEGLNTLLAVASDSTGTTPSLARHVTVETIPPVALVMNQPVYTPGSGLTVSWQYAASGKQASTFELFWATSSFSSTNQATSHSVSLSVMTDTLQGLANGTYYFGVVGFDAAGNPSPLSTLVSAVYNATPPMLSISYGSPSPVGPGPLAITLSSSKALAANPTLTIQPNGAPPIALSLTNVALDIWQTVLNVSAATTPSGTASVQAAAQDTFGNVFNGAPSGAALVIDTTAPTGIIVTAPVTPVQTLNPTNVNVSLTLSTLEQAGMTPTLNFQAPIGTHVAITLSGAGSNWNGTLPLTPAMGSGYGKFSLSAQDSVGNVGTNILSGGQLELYDTALPSAPADPTGLSAVTLAGGYIKLSWNSVSNAQIYRLYREPGTNFTMPATLDIDDITNDTVTDLPPTNGLYAYAVSASRYGSESGFASALIALSDRTPPPAPTNVLVALAASGLDISWQEPAGQAPDHYIVYRNGVSIGTTTGLGPVVDYPPKGTNIYIVAASDTYGNLNPSQPVTNVLLVSPVVSLTVVANQGQAVNLSWISTDSSVTGFNVYRNGVLQNAIPLTTTNYLDPLALSDAVTYSVTAVNGSAQQSPGRLVNVYPVALGLTVNPVNKPVLINYFDKYQAGITNLSSSASLPLAQLVLNRSINGVSPLITTQAELTVVGPGASLQPALIVPEASVVATQAVQVTAFQQTDSQGSSVVYKNTFTFTNAGQPGVEIAVATSELPLAGGLSAFQAQINNPSSLPIDVVVSRGNGAQPGDLYIAVENAFGQVVSQESFMGAPPGTTFLPDGRAYVQINPGASLSLTVSNVLVPAALTGSTNTTFAAVVTNIYSQIGTASEVDSGPLSGSMVTTSLAVPPYNGTAQTDHSVYDNNQPIVISGQAISTSTGLPVPNVALNIGFATRGYTWYQSVTTDTNGNYQYIYNPLPGFGGTLSIWAANPLVVDQLNQAQVVVYRAYCNPAFGDLTMSKNGTVNFNISLVNPGNVPLTDFAVSCVAYLVSGTNLTPISTLTGSSVTPPGFTLAPNQTQNITLQLAAAANAPSSAEAIFTFTSAEGAVATLTTTVSLLPAVPAVNVVAPAVGYVQVNVNRGNQVSSQITFVNSGLTTLQGITIQPPTNVTWMQLNLPISTNGVIRLPDLPAGQSNTFTVVFTPPANTPLAVYQDYLLIQATNLATPYKVNLYAIVTSDLTGAVQFQVEDFLADYLSGASVRLQNNLVQASAGPFYTDTNGVVTITNLTEGVWNWEVTAAGCSAASGTVTITADQTVYQNPILNRNLVTINFTVVPVPFTDQYEIQVSETYSTFVPVPVLVMTPPYTTLNNVSPGFQATLDISAQNAGLVQLNDVNIGSQQDGVATLTPLVTYIPVILPETTIEIPFVATYTGNASPSQQGGGLSGCLPSDSGVNTAGIQGSFDDNLAVEAAGNGTCPLTGAQIAVAAQVAVGFSGTQAAGPSGSVTVNGSLATAASISACLVATLEAEGGGGGGGGGGGASDGGIGDLSSGTSDSSDGGGCLAPDTAVLMADGSSRRISEIKTNDVVRSGPRADNIATVRAVPVFDAEQIEEIDLAGTSSKLLATSEHFFWVDGLGWRSGAEIRAGDWLFNSANQRVQISNIKMIAKKTKVYTLKLSGASEFYANNVLVHDLCGQPLAVQVTKTEVGR